MMRRAPLLRMAAVGGDEGGDVGQRVGLRVETGGLEIVETGLEQALECAGVVLRHTEQHVAGTWGYGHGHSSDG